MDLMQYLYYQNDIVLLVNSDFASIISYIKYEKLNFGKCSTCSKETAQSWLKILGFFLEIIFVSFMLYYYSLAVWFSLGAGGYYFGS
jgi:hypothetical protein